MKNIYEILKEYGLEVPADKKRISIRLGKKIIVLKASMIMQFCRETTIRPLWMM